MTSRRSRQHMRYQGVPVTSSHRTLKNVTGLFPPQRACDLTFSRSLSFDSIHMYVMYHMQDMLCKQLPFMVWRESIVSFVSFSWTRHRPPISFSFSSTRSNNMHSAQRPLNPIRNAMFYWNNVPNPGEGRLVVTGCELKIGFNYASMRPRKWNRWVGIH